MPYILVIIADSVRIKLLVRICEHEAFPVQTIIKQQQAPTFITQEETNGRLDIFIRAALTYMYRDLILQVQSLLVCTYS